MIQRVLICNNSLAEAELMRFALGRKFSVHTLTSWTPGDTNLGGVDAIVVDTNFTARQGLDFITEVNATAHLPVLIVTPPDDPGCAIRARRLGVFNYLVKTERLHSVLEAAILEAGDRFNDDAEIRRTALAQRQKIAMLQNEVARLKAGAPDNIAEGNGSADQMRRLVEAMEERLRKGEINLPSYPETSMKLTRLMRDQAGVGQVARLLEEDLAIAARLIGISNSARYRGLKPNQTIEQAVATLGLSTTKNFVDLIANRALYVARSAKYRPELRKLWEHSVACALAARAVALMARLPEPDDVFTMGILHDIGKLLLVQIIAEMEAGNDLAVSLGGPEMDAFLMQHHGVFGGKLLEIWELPRDHCDAARYHDTPDAAPYLSKGLLAVHLGNLLAKKIGYGSFDQDLWNAQAHAAAAQLKIEPAALAPLESEVLATMRETPLGLG